MSTDAESRRRNLSAGDRPVRGEMIERGAAVGVEIGDRRLPRVLEPANAAGVIERKGRARWLGAMVDLRRGDDEAVARQADARSQHRAGQLTDVRVEED